MYIALRSFFAVPRYRVTKVALSQVYYGLAPQLLLQMGTICPYSLQAVQYFKEYCFFAPVRLVLLLLLYALVWWRTFCVFRAVFVWWRKGYNFNRVFYTDGKNTFAVSS